MSKPVEIEFLMKDRVSPGLDHIDKRAVELRGTVALLEAQMEELRLAGENASPDLDQRDNVAAIEALRRQVEKLKLQLKELEEASENTRVVPSDLPGAERKFNGLHNSIQQMAREMPSLAMGPQMFFLAISNNLPIFTDELKRAKDEYNDLVKAGKKGTPVWKQVLGSLFSWQTAMTTGIMLLVMYGDEIIDWVKDLFTAKTAVDEFNISVEEMNELEKNGRAQMVQTRFELDALIASLKDFTGSRDEEKAKVEELNRKYGESFGYYDTVAQWYDVLIRKSEGYINMLFLQAKAQEMVNKAVDADAELNKIKSQKPEDAESAMGWFSRMGLYLTQSEMAKVGRSFDAQAAIEEYNQTEYDKLVKAAEAKKKGYLDEAASLIKQAAEIGKGNDIGGHTVPTTNHETAYQQRVALEKRQAEELLALRRKNQHDEIALLEEGKEKKLAQIRQEYADRMAEIAGQEARWKEAQKGNLDKKQADELERARINAKDKQDKDIQDVEREELEAKAEAMRDYLKEYGSFQQRKLAIAEEYADKIKKATTEGERMRLEAGKNSALQKMEVDAIKRSVDWGSLFGEFGTLFKEQLQPTLDKLTALTRSEDFKNSPLEEQRAVHELVEKLRESTAAWDSDIFRRVSDDLTAYQGNMQSLLKAQEEEKRVAGELSAAKRRLATAEEFGDTDAIRNARVEVINLEYSLAEAADTTKAYSSEVESAAGSLKTSTATAVNMFRGLEGGLRSLTSGSLQGVGSGLMQLDKLFNNGELTVKTGNALAKGFQFLLGKDSKASQVLSEALGSTGMAGQIIGAVLGILDMIAENGVSGIITGLQDTILGAVEGLLDDVLSGDILMKPLQNAVSHAGNILNTLTFGGFNSWFGIGGNGKEVEETINRLTDRNELLQTAIEDLTEEIKSSKGTKSVAAYRQAYENQQETNANYLDIARAQAGYHGSHHSWGYYWDGFNENQLAWIRENVRGDFNGDLFSLTPEEMKQLRGNVDIWRSIQDTGKGGYGNRLTDKLDDYIDQAGKLEELTNQLYEGLTGISFDGMYGSFVDNLMDMKYDAKAAAEDISEYFMRAMLSNKIGEMYSDRLKDWWEKFGESMEDNELTEAERNSLAEEYMGYVEEALALRDKLAEATGYDPEGSGGTSQSGKPGGFTAMTRDQGTKLEGMFTSGLQHWSSMDERLEDMSDKMSLAEGHLAKIEENTRDSAGHLGEIKDEIRKMNRDGLKMK